MRIAASGDIRPWLAGRGAMTVLPNLARDQLYFFFCWSMLFGKTPN
jgi:hypothetical protein